MARGFDGERVTITGMSENGSTQTIGFKGTAKVIPGRTTFPNVQDLATGAVPANDIYPNSVTFDGHDITIKNLGSNFTFPNQNFLGLVVTIPKKDDLPAIKSVWLVSSSGAAPLLGWNSHTIWINAEGETVPAGGSVELAVKFAHNTATKLTHAIASMGGGGAPLTSSSPVSNTTDLATTLAPHR
jgi:hypothetical protein